MTEGQDVLVDGRPARWIRWEWVNKPEGRPELEALVEQDGRRFLAGWWRMKMVRGEVDDGPRLPAG